LSAYHGIHNREKGIQPASEFRLFQHFLAHITVWICLEATERYLQFFLLYHCCSGNARFFFTEIDLLAVSGFQVVRSTKNGRNRTVLKQEFAREDQGEKDLTGH